MYFSVCNIKYFHKYLKISTYKFLFLIKSHLSLSSHHFHHSRCVTARQWSKKILINLTWPAWPHWGKSHWSASRSVPGHSGKLSSLPCTGYRAGRRPLSPPSCQTAEPERDMRKSMSVYQGNQRRRRGSLRHWILALVPDFADSCIEAYGRCIENNTRYLLRVTSEDEMLPENNRTHFREMVNHWFSFSKWLTGLIISWPNQVTLQ